MAFERGRGLFLTLANLIMQDVDSSNSAVETKLLLQREKKALYGISLA